jgi:hypothetical protein
VAGTAIKSNCSVARLEVLDMISPLLAILGVCVSLATAEPPPKLTSLKGWELYARPDAAGKGWTFGLLRGTNRLKTAKEVDDSFTLEGTKELGKELSRLAEGETVLLQDRLPDRVRGEVEEVCTKQKLKFVAGER